MVLFDKLFSNFFVTFLSLYHFVPLLFLLSGSPLDSDYFRYLVIRRLVLCVVIFLLHILCMHCLPGNK